jgi:tripartite-type tricarboxylate transporter receptor subunit TctC
MNMHRAPAKSLRMLLPLLSLLASTQSMAQLAPANYPSKPVRYLVPFTAGSAADTLARVIAAGLSEQFGRQVIVDNRGGAAGNIGADAAARAPADGYTILQGNMPLATNVSLYRQLPYDLVRDFAGVTQIASSPQVLCVHPSLPVKSVAELVRLAKAQPAAILYSSAGVGSTTHLAMEILKGMAGVNLLHVPYRGGAEAVTALLSGEASASFLPIATALPQARQGRLRAIAVSTAKRLSHLPQIPAAAEAGIAGYDFNNWYGLFVPVKTTRETILSIHAATLAALKKTHIDQRLQDLGFVPIGDSPDAFSAHVRSEIERLGKLIRAYALAEK